MKLKIAILIGLMLSPVIGKAVDPAVTADSSNNWLPALRNGFAPNLPAGSKMGGVLISTGSGLPTMTGQSGKYLTNNGTSASWAMIDLSAYQTKAGTLSLAGFSSITGRIGNANLPLGAQLYDNAGTPKLSADFNARIAYAPDGTSPTINWGTQTFYNVMTDWTFADPNSLGRFYIAPSSDGIQLVNGSGVNVFMAENNGTTIIGGFDAEAGGFPGTLEIFNESGFITNLSAPNVTTTRNQMLPNADGTLALTTDPSGIVKGDDTAYDATSWNGNTGVPTKNAVRDKFESLTVTSAPALSISGQTGLLTFTGLASTSRIKTVRDAADTILELGGSYTPTGTWTNLTLVTPALGTPSALVLTNATGSPTGISLTKAQLNTIVSDDDPAYLGAANTFTLNQINSYSGTASTPAMKYSGVPFAGTGTTSFPLVYINDANATASTTLSIAGTYLGVNGHSTQDLINLLKDGTSQFKVDSAGTGYFTNGISLAGAAAPGNANGINTGTNDFFIYRVGTMVARIGAKFSVGDTLSLSNNTPSAPDIELHRLAAGSAELTNATNGQWASLKLGTRDSGTNTITNGLTLGHQSTGAPAAGLGEGIHWNLNDTTTADVNAGDLQILWTTATHNSNASDFVVLLDNGSTTPAEKFRVVGSGGISWNGGATIKKILTATATLDFASTAAGASADLTITVTGAASGDVVSVGAPSASVPAGGAFSAWVSAADTVTVRYIDNSLVTGYDPASGTFRVQVNQF